MKRIHAVVVLCFALHGCADGAASWMQDVREASAAAEAAEARDDVDAAVAALRGIAEGEVPAGVASDDARVVRQDAHERLARLRLQQGDLATAAREVERGLALGERDDLFTANLLVMRGRVREAQGRDREAARDYHRALIIHEALLDRALGEAR